MMYGGGDGGNLVTSSLSTILHTSLVSASYRGILGDGQTNSTVIVPFIGKSQLPYYTHYY